MFVKLFVDNGDSFRLASRAVDIVSQTQLNTRRT